MATTTLVPKPFYAQKPKNHPHPRFHPARDFVLDRVGKTCSPPSYFVSEKASTRAWRGEGKGAGSGSGKAGELSVG